MPEAVIETSGLTRSYRLGGVEVQALRAVDLRVERGEFVAIMGSSGSGKSTLMYILGCLDRPSGGGYRFEGVDIGDLGEPELARIRSERIGFVFQSFNLLARTSAIENVALPLFYAASGLRRHADRLDKAREGLGFMGLAGREDNSPNQLSGGQQQRVAIARALINNPTVLLADEPTGNLDTKTSHEIMATIQTLNREQGVTVVVVTHEPDIAAYADRVITMRDGQIISDERRQAVSDEAARRSPTTPVARDAAALQAIPAPPGFTGSFLFMILAAAGQALGRNKLRSALTMLGVFIGVAALIAMMAVGEGANEAVRKQIESLGTNLVVVLPGATTTNGVRAGLGSASTLTVSDSEAIQRDDSAVDHVSYLSRQMGQIEYGNQNWSTSIQGVDPNYLSITNWEISVGRTLSFDDLAGATTVCLIGQTVYQNLFGPHENPVGAMVLVKGVPMRVVRLLGAKGQSGFGQDQDDVVVIPFSTAERKVLGVAAPSQSQTGDPNFPPSPNPYGMQPRLTGYVNSIYVQARSPELVSTAIDQVTTTLARRHHIRPGDINDFGVRNLSQIAQAAEGSGQVMALLLATVASISLLVGGIGIMNILLVSVTERTREIGIRMAIGARRIHVLLQFLVEAVLLSLTGGVAGIAGGVAMSKIVSSAAGWPTVLSVGAIAGGFLFSAIVGIFFGYYPARKAAHLDPLEALRYE